MKKNEKKKYYCDGSVTKFVYSATGEKLRVVYQTTDPNIIVPVGSNVAFSKEFANNIQNVFSDNNRLPIRVQV